MTPSDIMQRLASTPSRINKEQIIFDAFMNGCDEFFIGMRLALDPLITFGVAKVTEIINDDGELGDYSFVEFLNMTERLRQRELTGNQARDTIRAAAEHCHVPAWNQFYRKILLKNLNVGVSTKTINKVLQKLIPTNPKAHAYLIPIFGCQLAHDSNDVVHKKKIRGRKLIDTKLDGVRVLTAMDFESMTTDMFTRSGQVIENFPELQQSLRELLAKLPGSVMLDGEIVSPKGFQHLMTMLQRGEYHDDMATVRYALFDILPLSDFRRGRCDKSQRDRHAVLEMMRDGLDGRIYVIPKVEVDLDTADGQQTYVEFNRIALENGFEGIIVKDPEAPYLAKRSDAWLKVKPFISVSLEIIAVIEGDPDSKYRGMLGAFVCRGKDNGRLIEVNVGTGFTDEQRVDFWNRRSEIVGMIAEIWADAMSLGHNSNIWSLRFPRFVAFRGRIPGEKI